MCGLTKAVDIYLERISYKVKLFGHFRRLLHLEAFCRPSSYSSSLNKSSAEFTSVKRLIRLIFDLRQDDKYF